jgi:hypothetical protein
METLIPEEFFRVQTDTGFPSAVPKGFISSGAAETDKGSNIEARRSARVDDTCIRRIDMAAICTSTSSHFTVNR